MESYSPGSTQSALRVPRARPVLVCDPGSPPPLGATVRLIVETSAGT